MLKRLPIYLASGFFAFAANLMAAESTSEHADFLSTLLARKILAESPQLAQENVGVIVRDRVIVLWGPISSDALAQRAVAIIKLRPEFTEVRSELVVVKDEDPWPVTPLSKSHMSWAEHALPRSSGVLTGRIEDESPPTLRSADPPPMKSLAQLVRDLHEARDRYRSFGVTVEGATITVVAPLDRGDAVQDFMRALSRLPGVERVILKAMSK